MLADYKCRQCIDQCRRHIHKKCMDLDSSVHRDGTFFRCTDSWTQLRKKTGKKERKEHYNRETNLKSHIKGVENYKNVFQFMEIGMRMQSVFFVLCLVPPHKKLNADSDFVRQNTSEVWAFYRFYLLCLLGHPSNKRNWFFVSRTEALVADKNERHLHETALHRWQHSPGTRWGVSPGGHVGGIQL